MHTIGLLLCNLSWLSFPNRNSVIQKLITKRNPVGSNMNRCFKLLISGAAAVLCAVGHQPAVAALLSSVDVRENYTEQDIYGSFYILGDYSYCFNSSACQGSTPYSTNPAFSSNPYLGSLYSYNATALADYGVLKVSSASSTNGPLFMQAAHTDPDGNTILDTLNTLTADAMAAFRDQWTITGMPSGTTGTLQLAFGITGSASGFTNRSLTYSNVAANGTRTLVSSSGIPLPGTATLSAPFTFGTPFTFEVALNAGTLLGQNYLDAQSASIDLSHTVLLNAILVKDSAGNIIPFGLSAGSSATIFNDLVPAAVPVPAAVWLFGSGLVGLFGLARRRARPA